MFCITRKDRLNKPILSFVRLYKLDVIFLRIIPFPFLWQSFRIVITEQGKQLAVFLVVEIVVLSSEVVSGTDRAVAHGLELTLCLWFLSIDNSELLHSDCPSQRMYPLGDCLWFCQEGDAFSCQSFRGFARVPYAHPFRHVIDGLLRYSKCFCDLGCGMGGI